MPKRNPVTIEAMKVKASTGASSAVPATRGNWSRREFHEVLGAPRRDDQAAHASR